MCVAAGAATLMAACGGGSGRGQALTSVSGAGPAAPVPASSTPAPLESLSWPAHRPAGPEPFDPAALRGRWVLVQAITTTCAPCEAQLLEAQAIVKRFDLTWLVLLLDAHPERVAGRFTETWALDATWLLAPPEARGGALPLGVIEALPEYWVIDPAGQVRGRFSGFLPVSQVEGLLGR